jgi:hypothetical protein
MWTNKNKTQQKKILNLFIHIYSVEVIKASIQHRENITKPKENIEENKQKNNFFLGFRWINVVDLSFCLVLCFFFEIGFMKTKGAVFSPLIILFFLLNFLV